MIQSTQPSSACSREIHLIIDLEGKIGRVVMDFATYKRVQAAIGTEDYSDQIIHYTRQETLELMLQNNELWLGHTSDMNDTGECKHFLTGMKPAFEQIVSRDELRQFWPIVQSAQSRIVSNTYISSWCEYFPSNPDGTLPMWNTYGDRGQGIGIIVDSANMQPSSLTPQKINFLSKPLKSSTSQKRTLPLSLRN